MTIKEAFEALSSACANGMKNPFFVMRRLKDSFADVADKVVDDDVYSTTEHVVGKWIDGKKIYRRTFEFTPSVGLPANTWTDVEIPTSNIDQIINVVGISDKYCHSYIGANSATAKVQLLQSRTSQISVGILILEYTKSTT